jgi:hypothetical protein
MADDLMSILADAAQRARLPAGMRNNNPGNIKYVGQKIPGIVGPSVNTDQGDPQAVFDSPESGMRAMYSLLDKKYAGGKTTPNAIIAGNMGWTPGNYQAAINVARNAGIGPDDDIGMNDPSKAARFMIASAIGGAPASSPQLGSQPQQASPVAMGSIGPTQAPQHQSAVGRLFNPQNEQDQQRSFAERLFTAPAQDQQQAGVPQSVQDAASGGGKEKSPMANLFGSLALAQQQQQKPQFSPVQIQGPSADQANALANFLQTLRSRTA